MRINTFYILVVAVVLVGAGIFFASRNEPDSATNEASAVATTTTAVPETIIIRSTSPLPAPSNLTGTQADTNQVNLHWDSGTSPDIVGFRVIQNSRTIAEVIAPWYADASVQTDRDYGYFVQAIDHDGRVSQPSNYFVIHVRRPQVATVSTPKPVASPTVNKPTNTTQPKNVSVSTPPVTDTEPETSTNTAPPVTSTPTNTNTTTNTNTSTNTNTPSATPTTYLVDVYRSGTLNPLTVTIHVGDTVKWTYVDPGDEVVLVFSPSIGTTLTLDHERKTRSFTFTTAGTYAYHKQDGGGNGTIIVQP